MAAVLLIWREQPHSPVCPARQPANQSDISQRASQPFTKSLSAHGFNILCLIAGVLYHLCVCVCEAVCKVRASAAGVGSFPGQITADVCR